MSNSNPLVTINNGLNHPVDIYDVFDSGTLPFTYTKLATLSAGSKKTIQTIRPTSQLQAMYTGKINTLNNFYFYQFPIKIMAAVQFPFDSPPPLTFNINTTDEESMIQSFLFHRFSMANPNSALTKKLYTALKGGSHKSVNDFFSSTKNFKTCTLSSWNAIMSWLQMFTSGWQGPYYLYEKAPTPLPAGYTPILVATMNIESTAAKNSATLKLCTQDEKGIPVYPSDPKTTTIVMNGDGTMGDSNPGEDVSVNLTPVWMNVVQTTMKDKKPVTTYLAGPVVTGTLANKTVVSSQMIRQIPEKKDKKKPAKPDRTFSNICQAVGLLVGLLMLGDFGKKIFDSVTSKKNSAKENATSEEEFNREEEIIDNTADQEVVSEATDEESLFESDSSSISEDYSNISDTMQEDVLTRIMEETSEQIQSEIEEQLEDGFTPTEEYESAVSDLEESFSEASSKIENGDYSEASKELSDASSKMEETIKDSSEALEEWESQSLQDAADSISEASESSDALDTAQEDYEEDMENEEEDSGYDADEDSEWPDVEEMEEF